MNLPTRRGFAVLALLAAPWAQAVPVNITQHAIFSGSVFGTKSASKGLVWTPAPASAGLTKVVFAANIYSSGFDWEHNPFPFDMTRTLALDSRSNINFVSNAGPTFLFTPTISRFAPGPTVLLHPGESYTFAAEHLDYNTVIRFWEGEQAIFMEPDVLLVYGFSMFGLNHWGGVSANWTVEFLLHYEYDDPIVPVSVPDGGSAGLMLGLGCAALCFIAFRFHGVPGIA